MVDCVDGVLSSSVCESTDWPEKLLDRSVCSCCEVDDSAGGAGLCRDAGRWDGRDAMMADCVLVVRSCVDDGMDEWKGTSLTA